MEWVDIELLKEAVKPFGIQIDRTAEEKFCAYAQLLCLWNQKMNLTAITSRDGIALLHFADSLTLLNAADFKEGASLADVGTGAGFPSVPLAIMRPDMNFTLIDSLNKRLTFLQEVKERLGLRFETVHGRAEQLALQPDFRERFDFATARAVAGLNVLCEYCLPFVRPGGEFLAMKGPSGEQEAADAAGAAELLGGSIDGIKHFSFAENSRSVVIIKKIANTPKKYPRQSAKIKKSPL